nr:immunoglobulin light chain junction region [Macaca mulatta]MOY06509.1 immunoglobulin light chain junction region [Macaca mulatta]MOY06737.1 immunoglobulin light chain junction region [Macaca mulatta]MOY08302.1 immunoglobulin light chain junction region [Macaca mulatta]MOY08559.1 immunoglobulin light chain junction region [Macaca mulatta]
DYYCIIWHNNAWLF